jgi:nucleotide-binding universal stress UspA family protein
MTSAEIPALVLAMRLAQSQGTRLTLLQVLPDMSWPEKSSEPSNPANWLDAIDRLHKSLSSQNGSPLAQQRLQRFEESRTRLRAYFDREAPESLRSTTDIRVECRHGDFSNEVLKFCDAESVDLLILFSGLSWFGLPIVSTKVRRILKRARQKVLVVRPQPTAKLKHPIGTRP